MYRAPEMLDTWSNYPVDTKADIWACGCLLFVLCFHNHPFEDSAKLAIVNGNYKIPPNDTKYTMFHDLIRQMLTVDPSLRPDSNQVLQHLTGVSLSSGIDPTLVRLMNSTAGKSGQLINTIELIIKSIIFVF